MESSRRDFIKGAAGFGGLGCFFAGGCSCLGPAGDVPQLRFGVVSDVHVRAGAGGVGTAAGYGTETMEKAFAYFRDCGADAVVIAGDIADRGLVRELRAVADAWQNVFPGDRAPDGRKVERIFVYGNHDASGMTYGRSVFADTTALRHEAIECNPAGAWEACFHEEWKPFYVKSVRGFDFFCSHWRAGVLCNGIAESGCSGCSDAFGALMAKCDPSRPFFYIQHPHPKDTVYGGYSWGVDDGESTRLLSRFSNAVAFSGHSHNPLRNAKSIWRGGFTSVATGSLRYLAASSIWNIAHTPGYENGMCNYYLPGVKRSDRPVYITKYDAPKVMANELSASDIRVGMLVSVYGDRVEFDKREFVSGLRLDDPWVVERPARPADEAALAAMSHTAEFPAGARLSAERIMAKTRGYEGAPKPVPKTERRALRLSFPAAAADGAVMEYEISVSGKDGAAAETRIGALDGMYPPEHKSHSKRVVAVVPCDGVPDGDITVKVVPLDSFRRRGRAITAKLKACQVG